MYKQIQQIQSVPVAKDKYPQYNKYQVCFTYAKPKNNQKKQIKNIESIPREHSQSFTNHKFRLTDRLFNRNNSKQFSSSKNQTFYTPKRHLQEFKQMEQHLQIQDSFKYLGNRFPLRKKRSGEQQLLKLLLKFSDNLKGRYKNQQTIKNTKTPLFQDNAEAPNKIIPKLKTRTRFNWAKNRYCINRDKQINDNPQNSLRHDNLIVNKAPSELIVQRSSCLQRY